MTTTIINPDQKFIKEIMSSGGEDLKKCFQCATCSVVCNLSPDEKPYPRKEMIWTQWGLKEKLMGDPDIWLCHMCNDCSTNCPRGAKPGDVMAAVRSYIIRSYSFPRFIGKMLSQSKFFPLFLIFPAILLWVLLTAIGHWNMPGGDVHFGEFFPHLPLQVFFVTATGLAALGALIGVMRFWRDLNKNSPPAKKSIISSAVSFAISLVTHSWFRECTTSKSRSWAHLFIVYGFVSLFITTSLAVVSIYIFDYYPLPLFHPIKILGNIGAVLLTLGCFMAVFNRLTNKEAVGGGSYSDWFFLLVLGCVSITGVLTEMGRFADWKTMSYVYYFTHLVFIFCLLVYAPYSKFAHFIYRTVAMVHADMRGRTKGSLKTS